MSEFVDTDPDHLWSVPLAHLAGAYGEPLITSEPMGEQKIVIEMSLSPSTVKIVAQLREYPWCVASVEESVEGPYSRERFAAQLSGLAARAVDAAIGNMHNSDLHAIWKETQR